MSENWIFVSDGMQIGTGMKPKAKNGTLGVTAAEELVLIDDNGQELDRAPVAQVVFKFSMFLGDSIKINGHKWPLSFVPPMKTGPFSSGGGVEYGMREDVKAGNQRRDELKALVEKIQAGA